MLRRDHFVGELLFHALICVRRVRCMSLLTWMFDWLQSPPIPAYCLLTPSLIGCPLGCCLGLLVAVCLFPICFVLTDLQLPSGVRGQYAALRLVGKVSQSPCVTLVPLFCYPCATRMLPLCHPCDTLVLPLCYPCFTCATVLPKPLRYPHATSMPILCQSYVYPCATLMLPLGYPHAPHMLPLCHPYVTLMLPVCHHYE